MKHKGKTGKKSVFQNDKSLPKSDKKEDKPLKETELEYKNKTFNWSIKYNYIYQEKDSEFYLFKKLDDFLEKIVKNLDSYRSWEWKKIEMSNNGTSTGVMDISKLDTGVRKMVEDHLEKIMNMTNVDQLYKIEISGRHRVWGIRENECLFLIWNDPNHKFYKYENRNYTEQKWKS